MKRLNSDRKYIEISSDGIIEDDAFLIMGGSTKSNDDSKIGRFGSGLKYSIATLLSKGNSFEVYAGKDKIEFGTLKKKFRDSLFDIIHVNGNETNFSAQMGPDWSYYDAIRDIYANAKDEGLLGFCTTDKISPEEGQTKFYIEITEDVVDLIDNIEEYFSLFRKDVVMEDDRVIVYESTGHLVIYKSGFKIYEDKQKKSLFNYDFPKLKINEARELRNYYSLVWKVRDLILERPNKEIAETFVNHSKEIGDDGESEMWEFSIDYDTSYTDVSEDWEDYFDGLTLIPKEASSFYSNNAGINTAEGRDISRVPSTFVSTVRSKRNVDIIGDSSKLCPHVYKKSQVNSGDFDTILLLKKILIKFGMDMEGIKIVKASFKENRVKSSFDKNSNKKWVLISERIFNDTEECRAQLIKILPIMNNDTSLNTRTHFDVVCRFFADNFLNNKA